MAAFYLDNDVALAVAELLQSARHAAVTARALGREQDTDDEHLIVAGAADCIFVTHNESDFVLLHDAWQRWSTAWRVTRRHAGILVIPQGTRYGIDWDAQRITEALLAALEQCAPIANELLRRKAAGWERRQGRGWASC